MSGTTWDEIKKLAADFQRIQLVENSFKLSERNCIEIINKLIESGLLNVVHTIDGKDFLTAKQVEKEIYDELIVHEGRINIVKLQTLLNIDISHIEVKVADIVKNDPNLVLILGQIISKDYMNKMAEEINELLQERESVSISELTNVYELPAEFIHQTIEPRIGGLIKGNFDGKILFTFNFVNKQKALLNGILEACLKPVRFSQIIKEFSLESGMVFDNFNELLSSGKIKGTLFGGKHEMSAVFVPEFYVKAQKQYVNSFFKQNGYIEYSNMKKIGISEPEIFVKELLENQNIKFLSSSCFAPYYLNNLEEDIEDILNKNGFCDLQQILPSIINENDMNIMASYFHDQFKARNDLPLDLMGEKYLVKKTFLQELNAKFQIKMEAKADEELKKPAIVLGLKSERAIIADTQNVVSSSTNTSIKQSKSKTKKVNTTQNQQQSENIVEISFVDRVNLVKELKSMVREIDEDLLELLVEHFLKPLNHSFFEMLKLKIESGLVAGGESNEKCTVVATKTLKDVQETVKLLLINAKIFDKALKSLTDSKVQEIIAKHLAKTCLTDIFNEIIKFIATEQFITFNDENMNSETRTKILQKLKEPSKQELNELNQALNTKSCSEIIEITEKTASNLLEFPLKKADTKREKEVILRLKESTKEQLKKEEDPATVLHLVCTILYHDTSGFMLSAPGRCVPNIMEKLKPELAEETFTKLVNFQNLVIKSLSKNKSPESLEISSEMIDEIKNIGLNQNKISK